MKLKHIIPNMDKTFGSLEYAGEGDVEPVSYTHLDVYKRQV